ncbi:hypothetical protein C8R44DRAFT_888130 [Mycena epipterygia]|nr:hypothetical protein C8R44DRAFT_888130 [Mycena epipterygia]
MYHSGEQALSDTRVEMKGNVKKPSKSNLRVVLSTIWSLMTLEEGCSRETPPLRLNGQHASQTTLAWERTAVRITTLAHNPAVNPKANNWRRPSNLNRGNVDGNPSNNLVSNPPAPKAPAAQDPVPMDIDRAASTSSANRPRPVCYNCREAGHIQRNCPNHLAKNPQFRAMLAELIKEEGKDFSNDQE